MRPVRWASASAPVSAFIGVSMTAGAIALTRTPDVASSLPSDLVRPMTAALDAEYGDMSGFPSLPAMLAMLTIRPQPRSRMPGTNARQVWKMPLTLTAKACSHRSTGPSHSGTFGPTMPAELTRMSTGPACAAAASTAAASVTSTRRSAPPVTSSVMTRTPSSASRAAVAAPSPLMPPVTTAVRASPFTARLYRYDPGVRALVFTGPRTAEVQQVAPPVAAAGRVVVDVDRVGVCGTDVEIFTG